MNDQKKKKGCGCCGIGCLVLVIGTIVLIVGAGFGIYKTLRQYSTSRGEAVAVENTTPQEYETLVKRMDEFKQAAPGSNITLTLTAHELNVLIARSPDWAIVRGKIRVSIGNGQVGLVGSIPLSSIPTLRDQYLNGALYFIPSIESKVFRATIQDIELNGTPLPKQSLQAATASLDQNLNNRLLGDPVIGSVLIKAETLTVNNDAIVLTSAK